MTTNASPWPPQLNTPLSTTKNFNISSQNQSIQQLLQQGSQLANANLGGQTDTSFNGKQMANALRNLGQTANAYAPWTQSNIASNYGTDPYSEQSRMLAMQERGM